LQVNVVAIKFEPWYRDAVVASLLDDARGSINDELGCRRFDVLQDRADPHRGFTSEVCKHEQALEAHQRTPHFTKWRETVKDWFDAEPELYVCPTVFPIEDAWRAV
jgi:(4S)-4-hydroxy-5-phosphonooxypentane-2,3-dione isomerase